MSTTLAKQESKENAHSKDINFGLPREKLSTRQITAVNTFNRMSERAKEFIKFEYPLNKLTAQSICNILRDRYKLKVNYSDISFLLILLGVKPRDKFEIMLSSQRDKIGSGKHMVWSHG